MVQDKGVCGNKSERGNQEVQVGEMRMMTKERILIVHEDQDKSQERSGVREGCPRKETREEMKMR